MANIPDVLNPLSLIIPKMTTTVRRSLAAEIGTLVYDTDLNKLVVCKSATVATASWEIVTSVQDS